MDEYLPQIKAVSPDATVNRLVCGACLDFKLMTTVSTKKYFHLSGLCIYVVTLSSISVLTCHIHLFSYLVNMQQINAKLPCFNDGAYDVIITTFFSPLHATNVKTPMFVLCLICRCLLTLLGHGKRMVMLPRLNFWRS